MTSKYDVLEQIGAGGMATIHRARQLSRGAFKRFVAIKRILPDYADRPATVERFVREAQIGSELQHANIVETYDFGRTKRGYFMVMEYLEGWSADRINRVAADANQPVPLEVVLSVLRELSCALDHVHTRVGGDDQPLDIIHRDVSLGNTFLTRSGQVKLIDFGISSCRRHSLGTDNMVGKPAYMAPEALRGQRSDARVDVYGLGVVAWELLVGRRLFGGHDEIATVEAVLERKVAPPSKFRPEVPHALDDLVLRALARKPAERTQSAAQLRFELERLIGNLGCEARPAAVSRWLHTLQFSAEAFPGDQTLTETDLVAELRAS